jgi:hypothetical protein
MGALDAIGADFLTLHLLYGEFFAVASSKPSLNRRGVCSCAGMRRLPSGAG